MAVTTPRSDSPHGSVAVEGVDRVLRFDVVERILHWLNATLFGLVILTGAALYIEPLGALFGRRALVENVHVYCGVVLPVPLVLAVIGPWGRALRQDLARFNRWSAADREWLRALLRGGRNRFAALARVRLGKFNPGQKLNAAFVAGAGLVMLATGVVMRWYHPYPLSWRTGATFVHDWLALAVGLVVFGHISMALRDPDSMRSMWSGHVPMRWAHRHSPAWIAGDDPPEAPAPVPPASVPSPAGRRPVPRG